MSGGPVWERELFALRRALWEMVDRAQRVVTQFETLVKAQQAAAAGAADAIAERQPPQPTAVAPPGPVYSREVARAIRHIERYFDQPIGLARLARVAGCSRSTLNRSFRREVGQSAHTYLTALRLARAKTAMASGEKVEVVMLNVGFRSKRNFYRLFKTQYGITPAQFGQTPPEQEGEMP